MPQCADGDPHRAGGGKHGGRDLWRELNHSVARQTKKRKKNREQKSKRRNSMSEKEKKQARDFLKVLGQLSPETASMAKSYAEGLKAAEALHRSRQKEAERGGAAQ